MPTRTVARTAEIWLWRGLRRLPAVALAFSFLLAATPARAQPSRDIRARTDCLAGRYQAGVDLLAQLFAESGDATYIYNQARCYEQNGRFEEAILRFREFLRKSKNLPADEKAEANEHIAECQAELDKHQTAAPPPAPPRLESQATGSAVAHPVGTVAATPARPSSDGRGLRIAGIAMASVGVAAAAAGAVFSIETSRTTQQANDNALNDRYSRNTNDRGKLFEKLQWVGYGVGAALVAGGGVLYYLGYRAGHSPESSSVSLLPALLPGGSGAIVQGRF